MADFSNQDKFKKENNFSEVVFGANVPLLETELNELQKVQNARNRRLISACVNEGLLRRGTMIYENGLLTIANEKAFVGGELLEISQLQLALSNTEHAYLVVWEERVTASEVTIPTDGNEQAEQIPVDIVDGNVKEETSHRKQIRFNLLKSIPATYLGVKHLGYAQNGLFIEDEGAYATLVDSLVGTPLNRMGDEMEGALFLQRDPVMPMEAVTLRYAVSLAQGLKPKEEVVAATTQNISLYGLQTIDGVAIQHGNRVLVKNQTDKKQNGIYTAIANASWVRSSDANENSEISFAVVYVELGNTNKGTGWRVDSTPPVNVGTSEVVFVKYMSINLKGSSGITATGTEVSITNQGVETKHIKDKAVTTGKLADDVVVDHLGYTPVNVSGDTMKGALILHRDPVEDKEAVTLRYALKLAQGIRPKEAVKVATTGDIPLEGLFTVDGVTLIGNERVLVKNQYDKKQNGIYRSSPTAWVRSSDADTSSEASFILVYVDDGTVNKGTGWYVNTPPPVVIGEADITFRKYMTINIEGTEGLVSSGTEIGIKEKGITAKYYADASIDASKLVRGAAIGNIGYIPSREDHTHSTLYAPINHTHYKLYAPLEHFHDYASSNHSHNYAPYSHGHADYSLTDHNHNQLYANYNHGHDSSYASISHGHTEYASTGHNHDSSYAGSSHNHDSRYAAASHSHSYAATSHSHTYNNIQFTQKHVYNNDKFYPPEGFTKDQCVIIITPWHVNYTTGYFWDTNEFGNATSFKQYCYYEDSGDGGWRAKCLWEVYTHSGTWLTLPGYAAVTIITLGTATTT